MPYRHVLIVYSRVLESIIKPPTNFVSARTKIAEPNDTWTVEEALQYCLIQAHQTTEEKYNQIESSLNGKFEKGKEDIWNCHKRVLHDSTKNNDENENDNQSVDPSAPPGAINTIKSGSKAPKNKPSAPTIIHVEIIAGQYTGETYTLKPKARHPCWVGRSQGRKFKERGISLSKDLEISTTHGKFEVITGKLYYTDTGSTNGSKIGETELEPDIPLGLENGTEIILGQSVLRITLA